jgi:hypothetical protein
VSVSDEDVERACVAAVNEDDGAKKTWYSPFAEHDRNAFRKGMRAALEADRAGRGVVPDAKVIPFANIPASLLEPYMAVEKAAAISWNACREAMLAQGQGGVRDGWKLVPVEPTHEMCGAPDAVWHPEARKIYQQMLAAAPQPDAEGG